MNPANGTKKTTTEVIATQVDLSTPAMSDVELTIARGAGPERGEPAQSSKILDHIASFASLVKGARGRCGWRSSGPIHARYCLVLMSGLGYANFNPAVMSSTGNRRIWLKRLCGS